MLSVFQGIRQLWTKDLPSAMLVAPCRGGPLGPVRESLGTARFVRGRSPVDQYPEVTC